MTDLSESLSLSGGMLLHGVRWRSARNARELWSIIADAMLSGRLIGRTLTGSFEVRLLDKPDATEAARGYPAAFREDAPGEARLTVTLADLRSAQRLMKRLRRLIWVGETSLGAALLELEAPVLAEGPDLTMNEAGAGTVRVVYRAALTDMESIRRPWCFELIEKEENTDA